MRKLKETDPIKTKQLDRELEESRKNSPYFNPQFIIELEKELRNKAKSMFEYSSDEEGRYKLAMSSTTLSGELIIAVTDTIKRHLFTFPYGISVEQFNKLGYGYVRTI